MSCVTNNSVQAIRRRFCLTLVCFLCAFLIFEHPMRGDEPSLAASWAINAFGLDLLKRTGKPNENALISPYSIQSAMAMAYAGADGATRQEMAKVLHYPADEAALHGSFADLRASLRRDQEQSIAIAERLRKYDGTTNDPVTLSVANRLFGQSGYEFRAPFLAVLKDSYDAPFEPMDFVHKAPAATKRINEWVENQTHDRIRDIIPEGVLNEMTRLVLVNAVYLKAPWEEKFSRSETKPEKFHLTVGQTVELPMMNQTHEFQYARVKGFSMVKLWYTGPLYFVIVLPERMDGVAEVQSAFDPVTISAAKWERYEVSLQMPKLKLEPPPLALGKTLQTMGMKTAFDIPRGSANFDRMAPRRPNDYLMLSEVFHKTYLKLDEEGTEAAAATAIVAIAAGIHEEPKRVEMKVDHPFLFAIVHQSSGAFLFLGRVVDPR